MITWHQEILLGADFLEFTQAVISYACRTVTFYDQLVTLNLKIRDDQIQDSVLHLPARVVIAPRTVSLVPIPIPSRFIDKDAIIQPLQASPKQQFLVASILVHPKTKSSVVHILNPTFSELVIPKAVPIASIQAADPASIPSSYIDFVTPETGHFSLGPRLSCCITYRLGHPTRKQQPLTRPRSTNSPSSYVATAMFSQKIYQRSQELI